MPPKQAKQPKPVADNDECDISIDSDMDSVCSSSESSSDSEDCSSECSSSSHVSSVTQYSTKSKRTTTSKNVFNKMLKNREKRIDLLLSDREANRLELLELKCEDLYSGMDNVDYRVADRYANIDNVWDHPNFMKIKEEFIHESNMITNPPEISEGAVECPRCCSKRTFNYQQQMRSIDEGATTFIRCFATGCGKISRSYA